MSLPKNYKYSTEHEWVRIDGEIATIGITHFAQGELGDIVFVELPNIGDNFEKGDVFGTVEAVKTVADLYSPLSGEIIEINENLESNPESINSDAYEAGWIIKLKIINLTESDDLLDYNAYGELIS